jgi:hypothetical protein
MKPSPRISQLIVALVLLSVPQLSVTASAAVAAAAAPAVKITDKKHPDYIRCKTFSEIGSLVRKIKACRTNAEWAKINAAGNKTAEDMVVGHRAGSNTQ